MVSSCYPTGVRHRGEGPAKSTPLASRTAGSSSSEAWSALPSPKVSGVTLA